MSNNVAQSVASGAQTGEEVPPPGQQQQQGGGEAALAHISEQMARMQDAADMLHAQALANKKEHRKNKVSNAVSPLKSAAGKRTVGFLAFLTAIKIFLSWQVKKLMEISFLIEDVDEIWAKLGREANEADTRLASHDNLDRVNT